MDHVFPLASNNEHVLLSLLDSIHGWVCILDPQTHVVLYANKELVDFFSPNTPIGQTCWRVLDSEATEPCSYCPSSKLLSHSDNQIVWHEPCINSRPFCKNTSSLLKWTDGRLVQLVHSIDLSELKQVSEQSGKAKSDFLSRISHEIRTPMNAIIGMSRIANTTDNPQKMKSCLQKIDSASKQLLEIIDDILDMSKIESGKLLLNLSPVYLDKLLLNIYNTILPKVEEKSQKFQIRVHKDVPNSFICDAYRLTQVILNLLTNAVKFTENDGDIQLSISLIHCQDNKATILFSVTDNGIGISAEEQLKLYTAFEQLDGTSSRKYGGTGLGLSICKYIVELFGGKISVDSTEGKGSTFYFNIIVDILKKDTFQSIIHESSNRNPQIFSINNINSSVKGSYRDRIDNGADGVSVEYFEFLPYFDVNSALANIYNNKKLLLTMLKDLNKNSLFDDLLAAIDANELIHAQAYLQVLKDVAKNLSLNAIFDIIAPLETMLKRKHLPGDLVKKTHETIENTRNALRTLIQVLNREVAQ